MPPLNSTLAYQTLAASVTVGIGSVLLTFFLQEKGFVGTPLFVGTFTIFALYTPYLLIYGRPLRKILEDHFQSTSNKIFLIALYYISLYSFYSMGTGTFSWEGFGRLIFYVLFPLACYYKFTPSSQKLHFRDILFIMAIWIPVDTRWIQEAFLWPEKMGQNVYTIPIGVTLAVYLGASLRKIPGFDFHYASPKEDWLKNTLWTLGLLAGFLAIAIPFGFLTDFIAYQPKGGGIEALLLSFLATFLLVATPEEVLFRGIMQNLLENTFKTKYLGFVIASVVFGLSHANNGAEPDWRYVFIASIAGLFYGWTYMRTKSLLHAILVHTAVDVIWINFFYK